MVDMETLVIGIEMRIVPLVRMFVVIIIAMREVGVVVMMKTEMVMVVPGN